MPISYLRIHQCNDACKVPNIELCTEQTLLLAVLCWATATSNVSRVIYVIRYFCSSQQTFITMCVFDRSVVSASAMLWTVAHQATLFKGFPRQKFWSGLPFPFPIYHNTDCNMGSSAVPRGKMEKQKKKHELRNQAPGFKYWLLPPVTRVQP